MPSHYTNVIGATAKHNFKSVRVRLYGVKDVNCGVMRVDVDGAIQDIDLYAPVRTGQIMLYDSGTLADTTHVLTAVCTGDKNPASTGRYVNIDYAVHDIIGPGPTFSEPAAPLDPPPPGTRDVNLHPFRGSWTPGAAAGTWSIVNTPIGSGAQLVSSGIRYAEGKGGQITRDPIHIGYPDDPAKTLTSSDSRLPSGWTASVRVDPNDTGPGDYSRGNSISWFPLASDRTRGWSGHPLKLAAGGNPSWRYTDPIRGDDLYGQGHYGSHGGSHMSALLTIRQHHWDLAQDDAIQQAIGINLYAARDLNISTNGYRWPANSADAYYRTGYKGTNTAMKMGTLLTLPANYNWQGIAHPQARKIVRALWAFGFYVVDDSAWEVHQISAEHTIPWPGSSELNTFHKPIMDALIRSVVVNNNSPTSVGGGGTPRVPLISDVVR